MISHGMDMDELTLLARDFKALGHPARLAILDALQDGEQCVCHLENELGMRQAYISQQLAVLKEAGVIQDRREGWNIFYFVPRPEVFAVLDAARAMQGGHEKSAPRRKSRAARCPCPKCKMEMERMLA
jgi:DNA-binding transcriptional ArsR family regulator